MKDNIKISINNDTPKILYLDWVFMVKTTDANIDAEILL